MNLGQLGLKAKYRVLPAKGLATSVQAQLRAGFPARNLTVIGVTGTDGKTTTCIMLARLLKESGRKVALLSTAVNDLADGKGERPNNTHRTTMGAAQMVGLLKNIRASGAEFLVLEVSSHGLDQYRIWGIPFKVAVITNLSHEHLDYHGTMARYAAAKAKLFKLARRNRGIGIINADDEYAPIFKKASSRSVSYGIHKGNWRADNIKAGAKGLSFVANRGNEKISVKSQLNGKFNIYNLLAVIAAAREVGLSGREIEQAIPKLLPPDGRMMKVEAKSSFSIYVDYAVTPNALEKALDSAKQIAGKGRVILVFGATGDRDKAKRPTMGKVAAKGADRIYITDDETYSEDPETIRQAVYKGVEMSNAADRAEVVADRRKAIAAALKAARKGDVVLVTGLGHQTSRNMSGIDEPWSDVAVIKSLLK